MLKNIIVLIQARTSSSRLPKKVLKNTISRTKKNKRLILNLALNYGSKKELVQAFKKINDKKTA